MTTKGWLRTALLALVMMVLALPAAGQEAQVAPGRTALLVVDAFAPVDAAPVYADQVQGQACAVEVKGQDGGISFRKPLRSAHQPANDQPYPLAFSHGDLVLMHIRALLRERGFSNQYSDTLPNGLERGWWLGPDGEDLLVVPVDTGGFTLELISQNLRDAVANVRRMGYEHIVVNMSFAIIPCDGMPVISAEQFGQELNESRGAVRRVLEQLSDATGTNTVEQEIARLSNRGAVRQGEENVEVDAVALSLVYTSAMRRQIDETLRLAYPDNDLLNVDGRAVNRQTLETLAQENGSEFVQRIFPVLALAENERPTPVPREEFDQALDELAKETETVDSLEGFGDFRDGLWDAYNELIGTAADDVSKFREALDGLSDNYSDYADLLPPFEAANELIGTVEDDVSRFREALNGLRDNYSDYADLLSKFEDEAIKALTGYPRTSAIVRTEFDETLSRLASPEGGEPADLPQDFVESLWAAYAELMGTVQGDIAAFGQTLDDLAKSGVALVASAGNMGGPPYLPAAFPGVLAVSASYYGENGMDERGICLRPDERAVRGFLRNLGFLDAAINDLTDQLVNPRSNDGDVLANGVSGWTTDYDPLGNQPGYLVDPPPRSFVLGCLTGTSFAAPDVSVQMAIHFLGGG